VRRAETSVVWWLWCRGGGMQRDKRVQRHVRTFTYRKPPLLPPHHHLTAHRKRERERCNECEGCWVAQHSSVYNNGCARTQLLAPRVPVSWWWRRALRMRGSMRICFTPFNTQVRHTHTAETRRDRAHWCQHHTAAHVGIKHTHVSALGNRSLS
jgi:hypothetical protein